MNKPLYTTCPECQAKMAIPLVTSLTEIIGATPGCPSCGKLLFCVPPGKFILFDDKKHTAAMELPVACKECRGSGVVIRQKEESPNDIAYVHCERVHVTCPTCHGDGRARDISR